LEVLDKLKIEDRAKYKKPHPVTTYGCLYVDLSQFKIPFSETGVFVAIEYLGASAPGAFYLCVKMQGKCWAVEDGVWKLFYGNSPAISLELTE
jgi:hypothetical protein